jgi:thiamine phosphate synthase YjbQ (UPF0047 family)
MKIVQGKFSVSTKNRNQMLDITGQVKSFVGESGISDGDVIVYCPQSTKTPILPSRMIYF